MPFVVGHRGAPAIAPENTLASVMRAQEGGADSVEIDVRTSADGHPVLLHDQTFDRFWGAQARPEDLDLAQIRALRSPEAPAARVPSLAEVAGAVHLPLVIDAKDPNGVPELVSVLSRVGALGRARFIGELEVLTVVRQALPGAEIVLSWAQQQLPPAELVSRLRPHAINLPWRLIDEDYVGRIRDRGWAVWTYCVDTAADADRADELGLDAVITNDVPAIAGRLTRTRR